MVIRQGKHVARPEDVRSLVEDFLADSARWDVELAATAPSVSDNESVTPDASDAADHKLSDDHFMRLLVEALQDEIVPAIESDHGQIRQSERDREIAKKALVGLRLAGLRRVSQQFHLRVGGSVEELAERIAKHVNWDEQEIAKLIVENADDVTAEQGYATRIFPMEGEVDHAYARDRLNYVVGRYIRTAVARWFVFNEFNETAGSIEISGALETLAASVNNVLGREPSLTAKPKTDAVLLSVGRSGLVEVRGGVTLTARSAILALATACRINALGYVRGVDANARAPRGEMHSASLFLLSLLASRLPEAGIAESHVTVARFRVKKEAAAAWDEEREVKPRLKAVRLEGDYLFDSGSACRLLAVERRPLTDVTIQVTTRDEEGKIDGRFPMRIAIERDHVSVETGFGHGNQAKSKRLHEAAVQAVREELLGAESDTAALDRLIAQVEARAAVPDQEDEDD